MRSGSKTDAQLFGVQALGVRRASRLMLASTLGQLAGVDRVEPISSISSATDVNEQPGKRAADVPGFDDPDPYPVLLLCDSLFSGQLRIPTPYSALGPQSGARGGSSKIPKETLAKLIAGRGHGVRSPTSTAWVVVTLPANRKAVWRSDASRSKGSRADTASRGTITSYQRRAALAAV